MAALHARAFKRSWSAEEFRRFQTDAACVLSTCPKGFALARLVLDEAELLTIATDPDHRRKGVARALLADLLSDLRQRGTTHIFLEVASDNPAAMALYASAGFAEVGRRKGYYPRKSAAAADALILRKDLP